MEMEKGLDPFINDNSEILIIGTFPSGISICSNQYYANTNHNSFWKIIYSIFEKTDYVPNNYIKRIEVLKKHHIALCDIYSHAAREGNADRNIDRKRVKYHNFDELFKKYSKIKRIIFNGKEAQLLFDSLYPNIKINKVRVNSSSGNNKIRVVEKQDEWAESLLTK